jgi:nicotinamidase-related amidase
MEGVETKPWAGVLPESDVRSFGDGVDAAHRPISAGTSPAILVVDMTLEFVDSGYQRGHGETGWPCVAANRALLAKARPLGIPVYYTKAYADPAHRPLPAERGRWKTLGAPDERPGLPPGDVIAADIAPQAGDIVICKGAKPSGFFGTPLASYLVHGGTDTVIVTGMTTSGCVRASVIDAFSNNFHVMVPRECAADRSQLSHAVNLFDMHMKYADVVSLSETVGYLESLAAPRA